MQNTINKAITNCQLSNANLLDLIKGDQTISQDGTILNTWILSIKPDLTEELLDNALDTIRDAYQGIQDIILETNKDLDFTHIYNGVPDPTVILHGDGTTITIVKTDLALIIHSILFSA